MNIRFIFSQFFHSDFLFSSRISWYLSFINSKISVSELSSYLHFKIGSHLKWLQPSNSILFTNLLYHCWLRLVNSFNSDWLEYGAGFIMQSKRLIFKKSTGLLIVEWNDCYMASRNGFDHRWLQQGCCVVLANEILLAQFQYFGHVEPIAGCKYFIHVHRI